MAGETDGKEEGFNPSRRNLLFVGATALVMLFLGREIIRPNPSLEKARSLWEEYENNPEEFLRKYPSGVIEGLIAGPNGVNLRNLPSAQGGREGVVGYLKANEPVGTTLVFPDQSPNPDGTFLVSKRGNDIVFLAERQLVKPAQQAAIKPPY